MSHRILCLATFFLVVGFRIADAEVFERDWKNPGDGLLTFDNVNIREWLDLTETQGMSIQDVQAQLMPGEEYAGFAIASMSEVVELLTTAGVHIASISEENVDPAMNLVGLLGETGDGSFGFVDAAGLAFAEDSGEFVTIGVRWSTINDPDLASGCGFPGAGSCGEQNSVWLFRPVPEPSTLLLCILALGVVGGRWKWKTDGRL